MSNDVEREEGRPWGERPLDERRRFALEGASTLFTSAGGSGGPFGEHGVPLQMLAFIQNALSNLRHYIEADDLPDVSWASPVVELEYEAPWASFRKPEEGPLPWAEGDLEPSGDDLETADSAIAWSTDMFLKVGERLLLHALTHKVFYEEKRGRLTPYVPKDLEAAPREEVAPLFAPWTMGGAAGETWWADFLAAHNPIENPDLGPQDADLATLTLTASDFEASGEGALASTIRPVFALYPAVLEHKARRAFCPVVVGLVVEGAPLTEWPPEERERLWEELFNAFEKVAEELTASLLEGEAVAAPAGKARHATNKPKRRGGSDLIAFTPPPVVALQQAVADAAVARDKFILVDGNRRLIHTRGKAGYQVVVDYSDPVASVDEALAGVAEHVGLEAVFMVAAGCYHALEHEGEPVHAEDVLLDIGWQRNRDGARETRAEAVERVARLYLLLNGWAPTGEKWGEFKDKDGHTIDVSSRGPLFVTTALEDPQGSLLGRPAVVGFTFRRGEFLARARQHPRVLTTFGTYRALARLPRQRPADAWAVAIGLALIQRWRELARHARVTKPGEENRPAIRVQSMTRRYLLTQYPPSPTPEEVLYLRDEVTGERKAHPNGARNARAYWAKAVHTLRLQGLIDADVEKRLAGRPDALPRRGWAEAWLNESLDARPPEDYKADFLSLAERGKAHTKKKQRRRKPKGVT